MLLGVHNLLLLNWNRLLLILTHGLILKNKNYYKASQVLLQMLRTTGYTRSKWTSIIGSSLFW